MTATLTVLLVLLAAGASNGEPPARTEATMTDPAASPQDKRLAAVRDLNTPCDVYHLSAFDSRTWRKRAADLREQVLASAGLLPMPEKTPLNAHIFGRIDRGDYTIEKVYFESHPGFYVTGNLYRPSSDGRYPAVLNPHGHWEHGRLEDSDLCSVPGRCINFARQGYVAFAYDMVGYNDSKQIVHRGNPFSGRRERLYGISLGGLQLWNSIRAVDFLCSLPDVDSDRIACTGASGGGTQTFLLTAVDDRIRVSAPVNMISHTMQGGCRCENLPGLRIDTDNVEIGALVAPRPLLMVSATGDWTRATPEVEFPAIRGIYRTLRAESKVSCVRIDADHNYNKQSREAVYSFFGKWLPKKPLPQPVAEQPFEVEKPEDLLVFPDGKLPDGALTQDQLLEQLVVASEKQLEAHKPADARSFRRFSDTYGPALRRALSLPKQLSAESETRWSKEAADWSVAALTIREKSRGTEFPAMFFRWGGPAEPRRDIIRAVLLVYEDGVSHAYTPEKSPSDIVRRFLDEHWDVMVVDIFGGGGHVALDGSPVRDPDANFFDTYNRTDAAERAFDILTALDCLEDKDLYDWCHLVGFGKAGPVCLLAAAFAPEETAVVVDACGLDLSGDDALTGGLYVPCIRRAGDFRAAMALAAPRGLFIHSTQGTSDTSWAEAAYKAAGDASALRVERGIAADTEIVRWLNQ